VASTRTFGWPGCQYGGETKFRTITHSLETSMNHVMGMEIVKTVSDII